MSLAVLSGAIAVLATVTVVAVLMLLARGAWIDHRARRLAEPLARARSALAAAFVSGSFGGPELAALDELPRRSVVGLLASLAHSVDGAGPAGIEQIARRLGLHSSAAELVGSSLWWRRLAGARLLSLLGEDHVMPTLFADPNPLVRAQAAAWGSTHPTPAAIDALVAMLGDPDRLCQFWAKDGLIRVGRAAAPQLEALLGDRSAARRESALEVASARPDPRYLLPALKLVDDPEARIRALAAVLLGRLGGDEAAAALHGLLADTAPEVRAAAAAGLGRLRHWPDAHALAMLLGDPAWEVRRQAGLALEALGAPGLLLLRRAAGYATDPYAADMARQVLDLSDLDVRSAVA
jgi:HEAT repeat protein